MYVYFLLACCLSRSLTDGETGKTLATDLWKTWQAGMGAEAEEMEDPYVPGFSGEMPAANQYAVNAATENKRWTLQTLIILFRSFLNLTPGAACTSFDELCALLWPDPR